MLRVAIHQPNYIPWVGFFDKMRRADMFVILDHAAFSKGRDCWHARNRIRVGEGWRYLTIPVPREYEEKPFNGVFLREPKFKKQHPRIIQNHYSGAGFYRRYFDELSSVMENGSGILAEYNLKIIKWMARRFGIRTELVRSSELRLDRSKAKTELVLEILKSLGATHYLSGDGAREYLQEKTFKSSGMELEFQGFRAREYPQAFDGWVPNLSAIDLLFNTGKLDEGVG